MDLQLQMTLAVTIALSYSRVVGTRSVLTTDFAFLRDYIFFSLHVQKRKQVKEVNDLLRLIRFFTTIQPVLLNC